MKDEQAVHYTGANGVLMFNGKVVGKVESFSYSIPVDQRTNVFNSLINKKSISGTLIASNIYVKVEDKK